MRRSGVTAIACDRTEEGNEAYKKKNHRIRSRYDKQSDYIVGDIVMYQTGGTPVTHRIISENEKGYRTKGDANNTDDGTDIPKEDVVGKVVLVIPKIGAAIRLVRTPIGMLSLFVAIILITELPNLIGYIRRKGKKQEN